METIFKRYEKKYILAKPTYDQLMSVLKEHIVFDAFGQYTVRNIYWDTDDYAMIRQSLSGPAFKEKLRERKYENYPYSFMELKIKFDHVVYKRRIVSSQKEGQIKAEIDHLIKNRKLEPKVVIIYDREAYVYAADNTVRITFDHRIRFQTDHLDFLPHEKEKLLFEDKKIVMEIKVEDAMPYWLSRLLSSLEIFPCSCSKNGMIYTNYLQKEVLCSQASSRIQSLSHSSASA